MNLDAERAGQSTPTMWTLCSASRNREFHSQGANSQHAPSEHRIIPNSRCDPMPPHASLPFAPLSGRSVERK